MKISSWADAQDCHAGWQQKTGHLPKLDIIELRVGMNVGIGHTDELPPVGPLKQRRVQRLQHSYQSHIVLQQLGSLSTATQTKHKTEEMQQYLELVGTTLKACNLVPA